MLFLRGILFMIGGLMFIQILLDVVIGDFFNDNVFNGQNHDVFYLQLSLFWFEKRTLVIRKPFCFRLFIVRLLFMRIVGLKPYC